MPTLEELNAAYEAAKAAVGETGRENAGTTIRANLDNLRALQGEREVAATLIAAQQARIAELEAKAKALTETAEAAMDCFTFLVGREPNILVSSDRGAVGLVGEASRDVGALKMLLNRISVDEMMRTNREQ